MRKEMKNVSDLYRENGLEPDLDSYTALLAMYGEAGDMESIMKVSSSLSSRTQSTGSHAKPTMQVDLYYINTTIIFTRLECCSTKENYCNKMANVKLSIVRTCR